MCICLLSLDSSTFPFPPLHLIHSHLFNPSISTSSTDLLPCPFPPFAATFLKTKLRFYKIKLKFYKIELKFI